MKNKLCIRIFRTALEEADGTSRADVVEGARRLLQDLMAERDEQDMPKAFELNAARYVLPTPVAACTRALLDSSILLCAS